MGSSSFDCDGCCTSYLGGFDRRSICLFDFILSADGQPMPSTGEQTCE
jgi:hypothetical protein